VITPFQFRWVEDPHEKYVVLANLWRDAPDPPIFYSTGMLRAVEKILGSTFFLAVGYMHNTPKIGLPVVKKTHWQNVSYNGWDNLSTLKVADCSTEEESRFWQYLLQQVGFIKLTEWIEFDYSFAKVNTLTTRIVSRRKCPYINLPSTWDELNEELGKKLVRNIRQYGNKAQKEGINISLQYTANMQPHQRLQKLEVALGYHNIRMADINQQSKFAPELAYHQAIMQMAENTFFIEAKNGDNEVIACYYGLFNNYRLAWFNGGYSQDYAAYSLGTLLVSELITFALNSDRKVLDFLRGNESYKQKWTTRFYQNYDVYVAKRSLHYALVLHIMVFNDLRKRVGTKHALRAIFGKKKGNFKTSAK